MTKAILDKLQIEYETTDITIDSLCEKYSLDKADLKGHQKWTRNLLEPKTKLQKKKHFDTHVDILSKVEIVEDHTILTTKDLDPDALVTDVVPVKLTEGLSIDLIMEASQAAMKGEVPRLPKELKDGFDGLRKLDTKMQEQAKRLVNKIDEFIAELDTSDPKSLKDLIAAHTDIRNTYFNTKNTMVSIINGDVTQTNNVQNNLANFLAGVEDDC